MNNPVMTSRPKWGGLVRVLPGGRRRFRLVSVLPAVLGLTGVLATGCDKLFMQQPHCPELSSCGGAFPTGRWVMTPGHTSCSEDVYVPLTDIRLPAGVEPAARTPPLEPALYDWCDGLVTRSTAGSIQATPPQLYFDDPIVAVASVRYNADSTYSAGLTETGTHVLDFPAICMREFGAVDGNPAVAGGPGLPICKQLEAAVTMDVTGNGSATNVSCSPNPNDPEGCLCTFDATENGGSAGTYRMYDDHTILNLSTGFPQKVTYCNTGGELQLTGTDGEYLYGVTGLRTLDLVPAPATP
jgi:hypothetical protein